jgi:hypothetical protein
MGSKLDKLIWKNIGGRREVITIPIQFVKLGTLH